VLGLQVDFLLAVDVTTLLPQSLLLTPCATPTGQMVSKRQIYSRRTFRMVCGVCCVVPRVATKPARGSLNENRDAMTSRNGHLKGNILVL
jgi:hypothetical protein